MKILVLGADGMLGHQLVSTLRGQHQVAGTVRGPEASYAGVSRHLPEVLYDLVDVRRFAGVEKAVLGFEPAAVVNAVGIVKQRQEAISAIESIEVNTLLPHRLADLCLRAGVKLIHLSTDCVFSGDLGNYKDDDLHDARDLYGRSKSLGEVSGEGVMTLRTSIVGLELRRRASLVEWFLAQEGPVSGFTKAIFSGFTTIEMARIIERLLVGSAQLSGIYNVSSEPIDKHRLLVGLNSRLGGKSRIAPESTFVCDRSLDSNRFRERFGYSPPAWDAMLDELAEQVRERKVAYENA